MTVWDAILERLRRRMPDEDFHRWFGASAYASDAGDQITVWVPSESIKRHIAAQYSDEIARAVRAVGRTGTHIRFVVSGMEEDDEDEGRE
jgi:chromosomal replication initiation ATPase DnaA